MCFLNVCFAIVVTAYTMRNTLTIFSDIFTLIGIIFIYIYRIFGLAMLFMLDIVHSENNKSLITVIQSIHKGIDFSNSIRSFVIWNWISVIIIFVLNIFIYESYNIAFGYDIIKLLKNLQSVTFDANILYAIRVLILLRKYVNDWIKKVLKLKDEQEIDQTINSGVCCSKFFDIYKNILEAYKLYKTIFQALVSIPTCLCES